MTANERNQEVNEQSIRQKLNERQRHMDTSKYVVLCSSMLY